MCLKFKVSIQALNRIFNIYSGLVIIIIMYQDYIDIMHYIFKNYLINYNDYYKQILSM